MKLFVETHHVIRIAVLFAQILLYVLPQSNLRLALQLPLSNRTSFEFNLHQKNFVRFRKRCPLKIIPNVCLTIKIIFHMHMTREVRYIDAYVDIVGFQNKH